MGRYHMGRGGGDHTGGRAILSHWFPALVPALHTFRVDRFSFS